MPNWFVLFILTLLGVFNIVVAIDVVNTLGEIETLLKAR